MYPSAHATTPTPLTRNELYAGVYVLGCVNGLAEKAIQSVHRQGWANAIIGTFDVSVIELVACFVGISLVLSDKPGRINLTDLIVAIVLIAMIALPVGAMSWLAITMLSLYVLLFAQVTETPSRGAAVLLAATVPMLWSRLIFDLFATFILSVDATLVGWMLGTYRRGNLVEFADHSGMLAIFPSCSSLANVSLALLCWITISEAARHKRCIQDLLWCLLACASVVALNVIRISLMGLSSTHYDKFHSPVSDIAFNIVILVSVTSISVLGVRREVFSRV